MPRLCACFCRREFTDVASHAGSSNDDNPTAALDSDSSAAADSMSATVSSAKSRGLSPVLLELFTSQGCSSCPPADQLISKLGQGRGNDLARDVPVIVLAYHVDYWDYLGWKDPFASDLWTARQRAYGAALRQESIYTPEVVVQGRSHCVGSSARSIRSLIASAPIFPAPDIRVSFSRPSWSNLEVSLNVSLKFSPEGDLILLVVMFENSEVTYCINGENKGRLLTNDFIVRGLEKACTVQNVQAAKSIRGRATFKLWDNYSKENYGMAVIFQNPSSMEVYGAQKLELPDDP